MTHPNLLFIYTDEQRIDTLEAYGNSKIQMPHINRLASDSVVFEKTYCTQAVCTPSRSSLHTGLHPHATGCVGNNIPLRPETRCLPEMVTAGRYVCAHMGKWHLGDEIFPQHGFTTWEATEDTYHDFYGPGRDQSERSSYHHWLLENGVKFDRRDDLPEWIATRFFRHQIMRLPEEHSRPAFLGEKAGKFIQKNKDNPWMLYVNFLEPHMPFSGPRDGQYAPEAVNLPANFGHQLPETESRKARLLAAGFAHNGYDGQRLQSEQDWRELMARYWGLCSLVDTHVGRILAALESTGQMERTIIVFTSDHGDMMGSHGLLAKSVMLEESVRVPLMIRLPREMSDSAVSRVRRPVSQIDLMPTLLDYLGEEIPDHLHGTSLRPLMEGKEGAPSSEVVIEWSPDGEVPPPLPDEVLQSVGTPAEIKASHEAHLRTIVSEDGWKFTWSSAGENTLYDLNADPFETNECGRIPSNAERAAAMLERLSNWQRLMKDKVPLGEATQSPLTRNAADKDHLQCH